MVEGEGLSKVIIANVLKACLLNSCDMGSPLIYICDSVGNSVGQLQEFKFPAAAYSSAAVFQVYIL